MFDVYPIIVNVKMYQNINSVSNNKDMVKLITLNLDSGILCLHEE